MKTLLHHLFLFLIAALIVYAVAAFGYYELNPECWPIQARVQSGVGGIFLFLLFSFLSAWHKLIA